MFILLCFCEMSYKKNKADFKKLKQNTFKCLKVEKVIKQIY